MRTIIVIDDDNDLRENICGFLKEAGYNVLSANDGLTGLQQAISHLPNLILCEIIMPGMNGHDLYKTLQQIKSTSTIPLIFVTSKNDRGDFRASMNLGVDDFITKPINYNELQNSIRARLDKLEKFQKNIDEKFYALINNPLTGIFIYSNDKFDYVNETCAKIFGMLPNDFSDMTFNNIITGCDKRVVLKKIEQCFRKEQKTIHACFQASHFKEKNNVVIEMYAGYVNFRGTDSLVGYMTEM